MTRTSLPAEVVERFRKLLERAAGADMREPTAVALATADRSGRPSCRMVLLKGFDERGFVFFTNLESRKGRQLRENPRAAMTFYAGPLAAQMQAEGEVEPVTDAEADAYWVTRPRESRVGAWASKQSEVLPDRDTLLRRFEEISARYPGDHVPRPTYWSGYRLVPNRVEFWSGSEHRLHDRDQWTLGDGGWVHRKLYP